jgi:hypothetical protein
MQVSPAMLDATAPIGFGAITGLIPTNIAGTNTTATLSITPGAAVDQSNTIGIRSPSTLNWAVSNGNAANGYQGGTTLPNSSTIHFFICYGSNGVCSFASTALTPTLPNGYNGFYRRVFSVITNSSGSQTIYSATEGEGGSLICLLPTHILDVNVAPSTAARTLYLLSVPTGIKVQPFIRPWAAATAGQMTVSATSPDDSDVAVVSAGGDSDHTSANSTTYVGGQPFPYLITNASGQVGLRANVSTGLAGIYTRGWKDWRRL